MSWALTLLVSLTLPAPVQRTEPLDTPFEMSVGETVELSGSVRLHFRDVLHDSRCPVDVQCIRAGEARLLFEASFPAGESREITIDVPPMTPASGEVDGHTIHVESLTPDASSKRRLDPDEYRVGLRMTKRDDDAVDASARARVH